ncbi:hypothetical protein ACOMHN_053997 [Nucella lapillus]
MPEAINQDLIVTGSSPSDVSLDHSLEESAGESESSALNNTEDDDNDDDEDNAGVDNDGQVPVTSSDAEDDSADPCSSVVSPVTASENPDSRLLQSQSHGSNPLPHPPPTTTSPSPPPSTLSSMTVPGGQLDPQGKGQAVEVKDVDKESADASGSVPRSTPRADRGKQSPETMTSVVLPAPSLSRPVFVSSEQDGLRRAASVPQNHEGASDRGSIYEKMAAQALAAARLSSMVAERADDQPLDLSRKSHRGGSVSSPGPPTAGSKEGGEPQSLRNGVSSLESLQKRFGGDVLLRSPHHAGGGNVLLQSTILPSTPILRPPTLSANGLAHLNIYVAAAAAAAAVASGSYPHHNHPQPHHRHNQHSLPAKSRPGKGEHASKTTTSSPDSATTTKMQDKPLEDSEPPARKNEASKSSGKSGGESGRESGGESGRESGESKHTTQRCSCQKTFGTLYALSAHLQETGHTPGSNRHASLMDYPKLVRGQDMWLNQESEQTRRILRCMQCGESFKSLPMLTVHMMRTQHYSKIVSAADHGRRSHKCSAYCDRDTDRECIFKCKVRVVEGIFKCRVRVVEGIFKCKVRVVEGIFKCKVYNAVSYASGVSVTMICPMPQVCQETFTDMEGLANHMVMSGHHKKPVLRAKPCPHLAPPHHHHHRKHPLPPDSSQDAWTSLLEYKRKCLREGEGDKLRVPADKDTGSASSDGTVACDSCGRRVERPAFLQHVQSCQKRLLEALKVDLSEGQTLVKATAEARDCSDMLGEWPGVVEQPLPSTGGRRLVRRLNSLSSASPGGDSDSGDSAEKGTRSQQGEDPCSASPGKPAVQTGGDEPDCEELGAESTGVDATPPTKSPETQSSACEDSPQPDVVKMESVVEDCDGGEVIPTPPCEEGEGTDGRSSPAETEDAAEMEEGETARSRNDCAEDVSSPVTEAVNSPDPCPNLHSPQSPHSELDRWAGSRPPSTSLSPPSDALPSSPLHHTASAGESAGPKQSLKRPPPAAEGDDDPHQPDHKKVKVEDSLHEGPNRVSVEVLKKIKQEPRDDDDFKKSDNDDFKKSNDDDGFSRRDNNSIKKSPQATREVTPSEEKRPKSQSSRGDNKLDIIDPNGQAVLEEGGNSALRAMESFIQRSFSSRFDSRRKSLATDLASGHRGLALGGTGAVSASSPSSSSTSVNGLSVFSNLSSVQPLSAKYLDSETASPSLEKSALSSLRARSAELLEKSKLVGREFPGPSSAGMSRLSNKNGDKTSRQRAATPTVTKQTSRMKDDAAQERGAKKSQIQASDSKAKEVSVVSKYLNVEEEEGESKRDEGVLDKSKKSGKTSSALDSLSSFVYGQSLTSEHPLDSLQKLLTKSSMPRMMAAPSALHPLPPLHTYPPYLRERMMERLCVTPPPERPTAESPLNLSLKRGGGSDDEGRHCHQSDSPSTSRDDDDEAAGSLGLWGPDGELLEYKCVACSRSFASKGSYRYHLSRCHLSTVKKYGIKEAFSMSPYVYLPLDHTASFTKYYRLAQDLARNGKLAKNQEH